VRESLPQNSGSGMWRQVKFCFKRVREVHIQMRGGTSEGYILGKLGPSIRLGERKRDCFAS